MAYTDRELAEREAEIIRRENADFSEYLEVKVLEDNSIAILMNLMFTRAICLGATRETAYTRRFCFEDRQLASKLFETLKSEDDELVGYTARRPKKDD